MRQAAEEALAGYPNFISVGTPAEDTGLRTGSLDFVTAAQSFHWFDRDRFRTECKRILKSGGKVVLVWNIKDSKSDLIKEIDRFSQKYCPDYTGFSGGMNIENPDACAGFFKDNSCECRVFTNDIVYDENGFCGQASVGVLRAEGGFR
jgi:SAM-dependent methyltransferase